MESDIAGNRRLRALMAQAELTGQQLADEVNRTGRENGLNLRYDRTAVSHWLSGVTPHPPVPELVAEVLTRRLGRSIDTVETGLRNSARAARPTSPPTWWAEDIETALAHLHADTAASRRTTATGPYTLNALTQPAWPALARLAAIPRAPRDRQVRTGRAEIAAATTMTSLLSETDAAIGGTHALGPTTGYLTTTVTPWITHASGPRTRQALLNVAFQLSYLAGFMSFDANQHARAQRHYLLALRLAREADNAHAYALGLRALSVQARELGHHRHALDLAQAALDSTPESASAKTRAFVLGNLAVSRAAIGEHSAAMADLALAEKLFERTRHDSEIVGVFNNAALAYCRAALHLATKDHDSAIAALTTSLRHRAASERRSRAITRAQLAELHWRRGHIQAACTEWGLFLDDYEHVKSARADQALTNLKALTRPQLRRPEVAALHRRITLLRAG